MNDRCQGEWVPEVVRAGSARNEGGRNLMAGGDRAGVSRTRGSQHERFQSWGCHGG
jgi:hypothetical protein